MDTQAQQAPDRAAEEIPATADPVRTFEESALAQVPGGLAVKTHLRAGYDVIKGNNGDGK